MLVRPSEIPLRGPANGTRSIHIPRALTSWLPRASPCLQLAAGTSSSSTTHRVRSRSRPTRPWLPVADVASPIDHVEGSPKLCRHLEGVDGSRPVCRVLGLLYPH